MKLELKHIAPYLPYNLRVSKLHTMHTRVGIGSINHILTTKKDTYKPFLRPLSSLTKEIEVDGRSFIPIIELARLENGGGIFEYQIEKLFILDFGGSIGLYYTSSAGLVEFSYDPLLMTFTMMLRHKDESYKCDLIVNHQLKMFQKLFEWHFDVFGLIEKGMAVAIED